MKCIRCGNEVDENSKFCAYCGNPVVLPAQNLENNLTGYETQNLQYNANDNQINEVPVMEAVNQYNEIPPMEVNPQNINPVMEETNQINEVPVMETVNQYNEVPPMEVNPQNITPVTEETNQLNEVPVTNEISNNEQVGTVPSKNNKKGKLGLWILIIVLLVAAVGGVCAFFFWPKQTEKGSIKSVEKSLANLQEMGDKSGTVVAKVQIDSKEGGSVNVTSEVKYQKIGDDFNASLTVNGFMLPNTSIYLTANKDAVMVYFNYSLLNMFMGEESTDNIEDQWFSYKLDLSELDLDFSELEDAQIDIDFSELGLDKKIKYIGKEGNLSHYTLTIDKELIKELESKIPSEEVEDFDESLVDLDGLDDYLDLTYVIDLYLNSDDQIQKISINLSDLFEDETSSAILSVEFKDLNTTIVTIPGEVLDATDFEEYMNSIIIEDEYEDYEL